MPSSNRSFGFSTGAIAKGDFHHALDLLVANDVRVVELSALRDHELPELMRNLTSLDLSFFTHVSVHAPSRFMQISEREAAKLLEVALELKIGIVVHPDTITNPDLWRHFGSFLWVENLDKRKVTARTASELEQLFETFPEAGFCLDVAHARQIDPTMSESVQMLSFFQERLRQIHASGLNSNSTHSVLSAGASSAFGQISHLIPQQIPIILESPIQENAIAGELSYARTAFAPWVRWLQADIDDVFHFRAPKLRRTQLESFLSTLQSTGTRLDDFHKVVRQLPTGGPYKPAESVRNVVTLLDRLSPEDVEQLKEYFKVRVDEAALEFPDLAERFKQQFAR